MDDGPLIDAAQALLGAATIAMLAWLFVRARRGRRVDRAADAAAFTSAPGPGLRVREDGVPGSVGAWIHLAAAAKVAVTIEWDGGVAPAIHIADLRGDWRRLHDRPAASGDAVELDLVRGSTWLEVIPATPKEIRATTTVQPSAALAPTPARELPPPR